jgi:hypothetical protein
MIVREQLILNRLVITVLFDRALPDLGEHSRRIMDQTPLELRSQPNFALGGAKYGRIEESMYGRRSAMDGAMKIATQMAGAFSSTAQDINGGKRTAQKARDSHFPTAATAAALRLHFQCLDGRPQACIFKRLDAHGRIRRRP